MADRNVQVELSFIDNFTKQLAAAEKDIRRTGEQLQSFGREMSTFVTLPLTIAAGTFVKAAADAEETQNRFEQVFGDLTEDASTFATALGDAVGRSDVKLKDSLSTFQSFAVGMGFSQREAVKLSKSLSSLSLDFASFNNVSDDEALQRFISALSGSSEVLDRFGINIKQSALDLELQRRGLAESTTEATEQEKVIARLGIVMKAMTDQGAVGDAIRTQDSFTNQMKRLNDAFFDFRVQLGQDIIPALVGLVEAAGNALQGFNNLSDSTRKMIITAATFVATLGPAAFVVGTVTKSILALRNAMLAARVASLALLGPWGLVIGAATAVAGVVGVKLFSSMDKTTQMTDTMRQQIDELGPSLEGIEMGSGSAGAALQGLGADAEATAKKIKDLNEEASDIFQQINEDDADAKRSIAQQIIKQEELITSKEKELRRLRREDESRANARKIRELEREVAKEQEALNRVKDLRLTTAAAIEEAERRASLTAFERQVEDIMRRRALRLKDQVARLKEIEREIKAEEDKNARIQASFAAAQENIRTESEKTTDKVIYGINKQKDATEDLIRSFQRLNSTANSTPAVAGLRGTGGGGSWGGRALGGPVSSGKPYIVGERGPELFTPGVAGTVTPSARGAQHIHLYLDGREVAEVVANELMGDLTQGVRLT